MLSKLESVRDFLKENLSSTLIVSAVAVAADITYNVAQRKMRSAALISQLEEGERGREQIQRENDEESRISISRCDESARILRQLSHKGVISIIIGDVASGTTSLLRQICRRRPSTTYISLNNCATIEDVNALLCREFMIAVEEKQPTSFFIVQKLLGGAAAYFGSQAAESSDEGSADEASSSEVIFKFEILTQRLLSAAGAAYSSAKHKRAMKDAAARASGFTSLSTFIQTKAGAPPNLLSSTERKQQQQNPGEDESYFDDVPTIIFDDCELNQAASAAMVSFAHNAAAHKLRIVIVAQSPYIFLSTKFAHSIKLILVRPPSLQSVAEYLQGRCSFLRAETCKVLAERCSGRSIGISSHLCIALEEILCDTDIPITQLADDAVLEVSLKRLRPFLFATMRPLHLYTLAPLQDDELDAQRHAVFSIAMKLLDLEATHEHELMQQRQEAAAAGGGVMTPRRSSSTLSPCPNAWAQDSSILSLALSSSSLAAATASAAAAAGRDHGTFLTFADVLSVTCLKVWLVLIEAKRNYLPFQVNFDSVRFRAPAYRFVMASMLGEAGSTLRDETVANLALLAKRDA